MLLLYCKTVVKLGVHISTSHTTARVAASIQRSSCAHGISDTTIILPYRLPVRHNNHTATQTASATQQSYCYTDCQCDTTIILLHRLPVQQVRWRRQCGAQHGWRQMCVGGACSCWNICVESASFSGIVAMKPPAGYLQRCHHFLATVVG
jgi:hypothetical protein